MKYLRDAVYSWLANKGLFTQEAVLSEEEMWHSSAAAQEQGSVPYRHPHGVTGLPGHMHTKGNGDTGSRDCPASVWPPCADAGEELRTETLSSLAAAYCEQALNG